MDNPARLRARSATHLWACSPRRRWRNLEPGGVTFPVETRGGACSQERLRFAHGEKACCAHAELLLTAKERPGPAFTRGGILLGEARSSSARNPHTQRDAFASRNQCENPGVRKQMRGQCRAETPVQPPCSEELTRRPGQCFAGPFEEIAPISLPCFSMKQSGKPSRETRRTYVCKRVIPRGLLSDNSASSGPCSLGRSHRFPHCHARKPAQQLTGTSPSNNRRRLDTSARRIRLTPQDCS